MSCRQLASYFNTRNDQDRLIGRRLSGDGIGPVPVRVRQICAMRLPFEVLRYRENIQPVTQAFLNAHIGPHVSVGKNGVCVQVGREYQIVRGVGKHHIPLQACGRRHQRFGLTMGVRLRQGETQVQDKGKRQHDAPASELVMHTRSPVG